MVRKTRVTNSVKAHRFNAGQLTQAQLAERCGITRQTVIAIEQGRYTPSVETAFKIVRALGARFEDVFHYPENGTTSINAPSSD